MSSGKALGSRHRTRPLVQQHESLEAAFTAAGLGCPNVPPCRHGRDCHENGRCDAFGCECGS